MNSMLFFYPDEPDSRASLRKIKKFDGMILEYTEKNSRCVLVRIHSDNPSDYLRSELYPGADITHLIL